ncbi:Glutamyl-tRNA amidotransferase subunit B, mitochondrial [Panaeolus papilionaceus]|nr:Glutamyl-tRNA amidotransferase subunit B, mitochondrial [Panaeolus papilionaceus]
MLCRRLAIHSRWSRTFHDIRQYKEDQRWPGWQVIVGIETHAQIKSRQKLFSESSALGTNEPSNTNVSPFDAAFPGTLPKINSRSVDLALRTAVALQSKISLRSSFDRKHYFYTDLPSGYQITQQYAPLAKDGKLTIQLPGSETFEVRIKQIQLEQDTAKSTSNRYTNESFNDLSRAGVGLMEIVSEPDLRSPEEAGAYVRTLQAVLRAMGSSDGNMEQGSFRCDVNVSVNRKGDTPGIRCEIKNLNSVKFMMAAITHEIKRQIDFIENNPGKLVPQETRGFNEDTFETYKLRSKEDAPDYRYMPDPNLGTLRLSEARIDTIRSSLPPLPWEIRKRLLDKYPSLSHKEQSLDVMLSIDSSKDINPDGEPSVGIISFFEQLCEPSTSSRQPLDPAFVINCTLYRLTHELLGQLAARKQSFAQNPLSVEQFRDLVHLVDNKTLTGTSGKLLLRHILDNPSSRRTLEIAHDLNLTALSSSSHPSSPSAVSELQSFCETAIAAMPKEVAAVRAGNKNVINKMVGFIMKQTRGRADAVKIKSVLEELILRKKEPSSRV